MPTVTPLLGPDNAGEAVRHVITGGEGPLDVAVYAMTVKYAVMLGRARAAGRRVAVVLDRRGEPGTAEAAAMLGRAGVILRRAGRPAAPAHWKVIVSGPPSRATVLLGSGNLSARDLPTYTHEHPAGPLAGTREWWLRIDGAPAIAARLREAMLASAAARPVAAARPEPSPTPWAVGTPLPQVAPSRHRVPVDALALDLGGAAVAERLAAAFAGARRRCLVTVPYVEDAPAAARLLTALRRAAGRGVDVRLLLGRPPGGLHDLRLTDARLQGIAVRVMDHTRSTVGHAKGAVVDGTVVVGSANWSTAGLGSGLEAAVTVAAPRVAAVDAAAFERDWSTATTA